MCLYNVPRQPTRRLKGVPEGSGSHWRALHPARSRWPGSDPGPRPASSVRHSLNLCSDDGAAGIVSMPLLVTVLFFLPARHPCIVIHGPEAALPGGGFFLMSWLPIESSRKFHRGAPSSPLQVFGTLSHPGQQAVSQVAHTPWQGACPTWMHPLEARRSTWSLCSPSFPSQVRSLAHTTWATPTRARLRCPSTSLAAMQRGKRTIEPTTVTAQATRAHRPVPRQSRFPIHPDQDERATRPKRIMACPGCQKRPGDILSVRPVCPAQLN